MMNNAKYNCSAHETSITKINFKVERDCADHRENTIINFILTIGIFPMTFKIPVRHLLLLEIISFVSNQ